MSRLGVNLRKRGIRGDERTNPINDRNYNAIACLSVNCDPCQAAEEKDLLCNIVSGISVATVLFPPWKPLQRKDGRLLWITPETSLIST